MINEPSLSKSSGTKIDYLKQEEWWLRGTLWKSSFCKFVLSTNPLFGVSNLLFWQIQLVLLQVWFTLAPKETQNNTQVVLKISHQSSGVTLIRDTNVFETPPPHTEGCIEKELLWVLVPEKKCKSLILLCLSDQEMAQSRQRPFHQNSILREEQFHWSNK